MSISNLEILKSEIHEIHNYIRNHNGIFGMQALRVFEFFYGLKQMEDSGLCDELEIKSEFRFSNLLQLAESSNKTDLIAIIKNIQRFIFEDVKLKHLLLYNINIKIDAKTFIYIIKKIDQLISKSKKLDIQISGDVYEYFIGKSSDSMKALGSYFTNRNIVRFIYNEVIDINLEPNPETGIFEVPSMIDPFAGSGGFTIQYIRHLIKLSKEKDFKIDWKEGIKKVFHNDIEEDVMKYAGLEMMSLTKTLPDTSRNLTNESAFKFDFYDNKFKFILTNPPYGNNNGTAKKTDFSISNKKMLTALESEIAKLKEEKNKTDKEIEKVKYKQIKHQINVFKKQIEKINDMIESEQKITEKLNVESSSLRIQRFANMHNLKANDKESLSLLMCMDMLDESGQCVNVIKRGVLTTKTYSKIRKLLVEKYNIKKIIHIPTDQFQNTTVATSILYFTNSGKTSEVEFYKLELEKYESDKFEYEPGSEMVISEEKGDIKKVYAEFIKTVSAKKILEHKTISLIETDYDIERLEVNDNFKLKKIKDICEFQPKSKRPASTGAAEGKYNFYASSEKIKKCDFNDYKDECIIVGNGGIPNINIDSNFSVSDHVFVVNSKYNKYIYLIFKSNMQLLASGFRGSALKNLSKSYFENIDIPFPKKSKVRKEIETKLWDLKIKYDESKNKYESEKKEERNNFNKLIEKMDCKIHKIGDIIEKTGKNGKTSRKDVSGTGEYPYYAAGANNPYSTHKSYDMDGEDYLLFVRSGNSQKMSSNDLRGVGKFWRIKGKCAANTALCQFTFKTEINNDFTTYGLYILLPIIQKLVVGSTGNGGIQMDRMLDLELQIPKNHEDIEKLMTIKTDLEKLKKEMEINEKIYKKELENFWESTK